MSYHEIENIIEESIYIVESSSLDLRKKLSLFHQIYFFQSIFDVSNIFLQQEEIVKRYNISHDLSFSKNFSVIDFTANILEVSLPKNVWFASKFYSIFLNALFSDDFQEKYIIALDFQKWIKNSKVQRIRKIIENNPKICKKTNNKTCNDAYDIFPDITFEKKIAKSNDMVALISLLTEPKKTVEEIKFKLSRQNSKPHINNPEEIIFNFFHWKLWTQWIDSYIEKDDNISTIWYIKELHMSPNNNVFISFYIELNKEEKWLCPIIWFQFQNILNWQQRNAKVDIRQQHTLRQLEIFLKAEDMEKNWNLHSMCWWKFDQDKTKETLLKRCKNIYEMYIKYESTITKLLIDTLEKFENFSPKIYKKEIDAFLELENIPPEKDIPFENTYQVLAYLIAYHWKRNNTPFVKKYLDFFPQDSKSPQHKEQIICFKKYFDDNSRNFPEFLHSWNLYR